MVREKIKNLIEKVIKDLYKKEIEVKVERPTETAYGDYATNVAMVLKKNPQEIANSIKSPILEKIEIKHGFINFFLSKEYLQKQIREILKKGEKFGKLNIGKNKKINIEFISANPTGPLHIGNGRGAFFGDTLANVLERAGYKVTREYYINDAKNSNQIRELGKTALGKGTTYLNEYLKCKIQNTKIKTKIQNAKLDESEAGYLLAQEIQKDNKNFIEKKLKIKFDNWVSEEELYKKNKVDKIFKWLKRKNLVYQKEGAWWIKTSEFGDSQDWVIIRSEKEGGEPTYLLPDIAYHQDKFARGFQKIINIWGADHQAHVSKIKAAAKMLGYKGNLDILISQVVRLKKGKISKRKGEIVTLEWLTDEVGLDPARFLYLMKSLDTQMEFDVGLAKEKSEKSPVYYVQYAHARICAILRKSGKSEIRNPKSETNFSPKILNSKLELLSHPSELELIKQLIRFPEIIEDTTKDYQVQRIPQYAIDLATVFHQFYRNCSVLRPNEKRPVIRSNEKRIETNEKRIVLKDESYRLMSLLFEIHNKLGSVYKGKNYKDAIEEILKREEIPYEREKKITLRFENLEISDFFADFVIDNKILLEVKAEKFITQEDIRQTLRYIKSLNLPLGIIVNFRRNKLEYKRLINPIFDFNSLSFDKNSSDLREARLALILATKTILKNTLNLMGISAPERM